MTMDANDDSDNAEDGAMPSRSGVLWRLLDRFGLTRHPIAQEQDPDTEAKDEQKKLQEWLEKTLRLTTNRIERYRIFQMLDQFDLIQAVFNTYAEEGTQKDLDKGKSVWVESKHPHMIDKGETCFQNIMIEDRLFALDRQTLLLGDQFRRLVYQSGQGVLGWHYADPKTVHRQDDKYDRLVGFKQDGQTFRGKRKYAVSWPWDFIHFRLMGKYDDSQYGTSECEPLYRSARQLILMEDSDLLYNLRRAAERNLVLVDTGDLDDVEATDRLSRWRKRLKKHEFIDPNSPRYTANYNPWSPLEDIFVAIRGPDDQTRIESLAGSSTPLSPERLDYYRKKFFGIARIPQAYLGFADGGDTKSNLLQLDCRFARTIKRSQKMLIYGLRNTLDVHYMLCPQDGNEEEMKKFDPELNPYTVQMSPIAYLDEWSRLELVQLRMSLVESVAGLGQALHINERAWSIYILLHYAKLPENVIQMMLRRADQIPEEPQAPTQKEGLAGAVEWKRKQLITEVEKRWGPRKGSKWSEGFYDLKPEEEKQIAEAIHNSPYLRMIIGNIAENHEDDIVDQVHLTQTDWSVRPPRKSNGDPVRLEDSIDWDKESEILYEHAAQDGLGMLLD